MTRTIAWAAAVLLSTASLAALAQAPSGTAPAAPVAATTTPKDSAVDKKFVAKAGSGGLAEVQAAQLAQQKSQDPKVKDFAQQMITDHTAINQELTTLAQQKGLTLPAAPDDKDQKEIDKLQGLSGSKFDRAYMKGQSHDHEAMLKLLQHESKSGKDADLKAFADKTIPTIEKHIDLLKSDKS